MDEAGGPSELSGAVAALIDATGDEDNEFRFWAVVALGKALRWGYIMPSMMNAVIGILEKGLDDSEGGLAVSAVAVRALEEVCQPGGTSRAAADAAAEVLKKALGHENRNVRCVAAEGLGKAGRSHEVFTALIDNLQDWNPYVITYARSALAEACRASDQAVAELVRTFRRADATLRSSIASVLCDACRLTSEAADVLGNGNGRVRGVLPEWREVS
jgi:HEAT repeat protein